MNLIKTFALFILVGLWLGSPLAVFAQTGCVEGNCTDGYGMYKYTTGDKYVGNFSGGVKSGYGVYTWSNGEVFLGNWSNDKQNGKGICIYKSGQRYDGNYVNGSREGYGTYYWPNGDRYEGDFKYNKMNGQGAYYFASGSVNRGKFVDDKFQGTNTSSSGNNNNNNASSGDFCTEFKKVQQEMRYEFSGIRGTEYTDEYIGTYWIPTVMLPGALEGDISDPIGFGMNCSYDFIKNGSKSKAEDMYQDLKSKMKRCKPSGWHETETGPNEYDKTLVKKFQIEDDRSKENYGLKGHRIYLYWTNDNGNNKIVMWFTTNKE